MTFNHIGTAKIYVDGELIGTGKFNGVRQDTVRVQEFYGDMRGTLELTLTQSAREYWAARLFFIGGCQLPRGMQQKTRKDKHHGQKI